MTGRVILEIESAAITTSYAEHISASSKEDEPRTTAKIFRFVEYQSVNADDTPNTRSVLDFVREFGSENPSSTRRARRRLWTNSISPENRGLKALRLEKGLSQSEVAEAIESSQSHIANLEGGCVEPTLSMCRRLARVFSVDLARIDEAFAWKDGA